MSSFPHPIKKSCHSMLLRSTDLLRLIYTTKRSHKSLPSTKTMRLMSTNRKLLCRGILSVNLLHLHKNQTYPVIIPGFHLAKKTSKSLCLFKQIMGLLTFLIYRLQYSEINKMWFLDKWSIERTQWVRAKPELWLVYLLERL